MSKKIYPTDRTSTCLDHSKTEGKGWNTISKFEPTSIITDRFKSSTFAFVPSCRVYVVQVLSLIIHVAVIIILIHSTVLLLI